MTMSDHDDEQLRILLRFILHINEVNQDLRRLVCDIEDDKTSITAVCRYYEAFNEIQMMITSGPSLNLVDYLVELDRLDDAHRYFKQIHDEDQHKRSGQLYNIGLKKLIEESDELIMFHSIPLNSDDLLELSKSTIYQPINPEEMQESSLSTFRIIFDWFKEHGYQQGLINLYATKRGNMICSSLKLLGEYLAKKSVRRASISLFTASPCLSSSRSSLNGHRIARSPVFGSRDTSSRRNSLLVPPKPHEEENTINVDGIASSIRFSNDQEANRYKYLLDAFVILLLRDVDLLFYVFEAEFKSIILHKLIEIPLTYLYEEAKQLCKAINELTNKIYHGKFAFYSLISVIRWFYRSNPLLTQFYQESDLKLSQQQQQQFTNTLLILFENSLMEYLRLVLNEIQNESSPISSNCQVHSLTVHVFDYMEDYLNYESIITTVHKNQNSIVPSCIYMGELYRILCRNIFEKRPESIVYDDSVIRAIFLLNNTTYIFKRIESSSLLSIMELIHPNLKSNIETYIEKSIKIYMKCCLPIITAMQEMFHYDDLYHLPNNQLKDSDRSQLKSNFSMVNTAIDTFRRQNQSYVIDDSQLRDRLRSELKQSILDMFTKYYTKFASKNFTHHPEKYIRYNPSTFNNLIEQLFED
uniref:Exocyst complex component 7 n=1 Tax=Adineta vaga TaxID=104782 RepID=B3G484_ADIVA|nr:exocyst complex component 7-like protein [Adineta vaga]